MRRGASFLLAVLIFLSAIAVPSVTMPVWAEDDANPDTTSFAKLASAAAGFMSDAVAHKEWKTADGNKYAEVIGSNNRFSGEDATLVGGTAGGFLGFPDAKNCNGVTYNWLASTHAMSSVTYAYSALRQIGVEETTEPEEGGSTYKSKVNSFIVYAMYGRILSNIGLDSTGTEKKSLVAWAVGGLLSIGYNILNFVNSIFLYTLKALQFFNPFGWLPEFHKPGESIEVAEAADGELDLNQFTRIYNMLADTWVWTLVIPIFFVVLLVNLLLRKGTNKPQEIKKFLWRVFTMTLLFFVLGGVYNTVLDAMLAENTKGQGKLSPATKVMMATFFDFQTWCENAHMSLPSGVTLTADADGNISDETLLGARNLAVRLNYYALQCKLHGQVSGATGGSYDSLNWMQSAVENSSDQNTVDWNESILDSTVDFSTAAAEWVSDVLSRYGEGAKYKSSDWESYYKNKYLDYSNADDSDPQSPGNCISNILQHTDDALEWKVMGTEENYNTPGKQMVTGTGNVSFTNGGETYYYNYSCNPWSVWRGYATDPRNPLMGGGSGYIGRIDDNVTKIVGNNATSQLSPMSIYNYLSSNFTDTGITVYNPETTSSDYVRYSHNAVTLVGPSSLRVLYLLNAAVIMLCMAVIGVFYCFAIIISAVKRTISTVLSVPFAMLGSLRFSARIIYHVIMLVAEVIVTLLLYSLVFDVMTSMMTMVDTVFGQAIVGTSTMNDLVGSPAVPATTLLNVNAGTIMFSKLNLLPLDDGIAVKFSAMVLELVSNLLMLGLYIVFTIMLIRYRKVFVKSVDEMVGDWTMSFVPGARSNDMHMPDSSIKSGIAGKVAGAAGEAVGFGAAMKHSAKNAAGEDGASQDAVPDADAFGEAEAAETAEAGAEGAAAERATVSGEAAGGSMIEAAPDGTRITVPAGDVGTAGSDVVDKAAGEAALSQDSLASASTVSSTMTTAETGSEFDESGADRVGQNEIHVDVDGEDGDSSEFDAKAEDGDNGANAELMAGLDQLDKQLEQDAENKQDGYMPVEAVEQAKSDINGAKDAVDNVAGNSTGEAEKNAMAQALVVSSLTVGSLVANAATMGANAVAASELSDSEKSLVAASVVDNMRPEDISRNAVRDAAVDAVERATGSVSEEEKKNIRAMADKAYDEAKAAEKPSSLASNAAVFAASSMTDKPLTAEQQAKVAEAGRKAGEDMEQAMSQKGLNSREALKGAKAVATDTMTDEDKKAVFKAGDAAAANHVKKVMAAREQQLGRPLTQAEKADVAEAAKPGAAAAAAVAGANTLLERQGGHKLSKSRENSLYKQAERDAQKVIDKNSSPEEVGRKAADAAAGVLTGKRATADARAMATDMAGSQMQMGVRGTAAANAAVAAVNHSLASKGQGRLSESGADKVASLAMDDAASHVKSYEQLGRQAGQQGAQMIQRQGKTMPGMSKQDVRELGGMAGGTAAAAAVGTAVAVGAARQSAGQVGRASSTSPMDNDLTGTVFEQGPQQGQPQGGGQVKMSAKQTQAMIERMRQNAGQMTSTGKQVMAGTSFTGGSNPISSVRGGVNTLKSGYEMGKMGERTVKNAEVLQGSMSATPMTEKKAAKAADKLMKASAETKQMAREYKKDGKLKEARELYEQAGAMEARAEAISPGSSGRWNQKQSAASSKKAMKQAKKQVFRGALLASSDNVLLGAVGQGMRQGGYMRGYGVMQNAMRKQGAAQQRAGATIAAGSGDGTYITDSYREQLEMMNAIKWAGGGEMSPEKFAALTDAQKLTRYRAAKVSNARSGLSSVTPGMSTHETGVVDDSIFGAGLGGSYTGSTADEASDV